MTPAELVEWGGTDLALTLWPEWAWAIVHLDKDVENRGYNLLLKDRRLREAKGRLFIHAGKTISGGQLHEREARVAVINMATRAGWAFNSHTCVFTKGERHVLFDFAVLPRSALVAAVRVSGVLDRVAGSGWKVPGQYGHVFADIRLLPQPIPCKGAQGLWSVSAALSKAV